MQITQAITELEDRSRDALATSSDALVLLVATPLCY